MSVKKRRKNAPPPQGQEQPRRFWLGWLPVTVAGLAALVTLANVLMSISLLDEGVTCMGAWRIVQGDVPYRDFFEFIPPFSFYLLALFYKALGVSILSGRVLAVLVGLGIILLGFRLCRKFVRDPLYMALPLAFLIQAGAAAWPYPSHHWLANLLTLAALLAADRWWGHRTVLAFFLCGLFSALTAWTLSDQGFYLVLGTALFVLPWVPGPGKRWKAILGWAGGGAAGSVPFLLLLLKVPASLLWYDLVTFGLTVYKDNPGNRLGPFHPFKGIAQQWIQGQWKAAPLYTTAASVTSAAIALAIPVSIALLLVGWRRKWGDGWTRGWLAVGTAAFAGTAFHRWGPINLQWAALMPATVMAWSLSHWEREAQGGTKRAPRALAWALVGCFAFVGLSGLARLLKPGALSPVSAPGGTLYSLKRPQAAALQELLDTIGSNVPAGSPVLCREMPLVNFLAQRPCPIPYNFFYPPYETSEAQEKESIAILEKNKVQWVTTYAGPPPPCAFNGYLESRFTPTWGNDQFLLWRRDEAKAAGP